MTTRSAAASLALLLAPVFLLADLSRASAGQCCHCAKTVFCRPQAPKIKYKCVCPKPICPLCGMENFGYYPTCWRSWPYPPNYAHCPVPPTIATAPCSPIGMPMFRLDQLPAPTPMPPAARLN